MFYFRLELLEKTYPFKGKNSLFKTYCLGVQALLEHRWGVGILEKLKWLFDENIINFRQDLKD